MLFRMYFLVVVEVGILVSLRLTHIPRRASRVFHFEVIGKINAHVPHHAGAIFQIIRSELLKSPPDPPVLTTYTTLPKILPHVIHPLAAVEAEATTADTVFCAGLDPINRI
ncbi:hypothetical protein F5144DRAFT_571886 [Chaetomium tenue]|uniref:Uncharacterized protein n=1 Tax=Chaetomium tenue TaxID=1854479 RepID=A0ACB7PBV5_9PEZI|nr:hypothetical protein F5144DRAFT_571886 [Chaetomium globosum]